MTLETQQEHKLKIYTQNIQEGREFSPFFFFDIVQI